MLLLAAAAIAASPPQKATMSAGASAQATVSVRVISGALVSFGRPQRDPDIPPARRTVIHTADAQQQPAELIEFQ